MRRFTVVLIVLVMLSVLASSSTALAGHVSFWAALSGAEEVPSVMTNGRGFATFQLSHDGTELDFQLYVFNTRNVTQAHIHCGPQGVNGPVVVFLFGFIPDGVTMNGLLSSGTRTNGDVIARPSSAVCPGGVSNFADVLAKIKSGFAYVNVHTIAYPGGEIRGQMH